MADLNWLDRSIGWLAPGWGARRAQARAATEALLAYEGARVGRRESGWTTGSQSANAAISTDRVTLRNRARSLLRDNPYAVKGVATLVANRVGTGILASPNGANKRLNKRLQDQFWEWTDRTNYYATQALAERARIESGEVFIVFRTLTEPAYQGDPGLRLDVFESDHLDTTQNASLDSDGREVIEGIEYRNGTPVAYYLYPTHPGDTSTLTAFSFKSERIPASRVLHYYRKLRPGQLTGVTELSPVIRRLYDLDGYADAELMRKRIAACSVGAVTTPGGLPGASLAPTDTDADGRTTESFSPGMYHYFKPGESVTFHDPKPSGDYREFFNVELHAIAAGLGVPFSLLTGDYSETNYTSFRAALVQFKAAVEADQWQLLIPNVALPVWDRFTAYVAGTTVPAKFTPPRFGLLDPAKETGAMIEAVQGGLTTWRETVRRSGYEPDEVMDEIASERAEFQRRGIAVTSIQGATSPMPTPPPSRETPDNEPDDEEEEAA